MATREAAIPAAVRSWYSEIKNGYDFDTGVVLISPESHISLTL